MATLTNEGRKRLEAIIMDVSNEWAIRLHTGTPFTRSSMAIDVSEAFFSGYSSKAVSHGEITVTAEGVAICLLDPVTFTHNGGSSSATVTAWVVVDTATGVLLFYRNLASPVSFAVDGDTLTVQPIINLSQGV